MRNGIRLIFEKNKEKEGKFLSHKHTYLLERERERMAVQAQMYSENFGFAFGPGLHQDTLIENACGVDTLCLVPQQQLEFGPLDQVQTFNHPKNHGFLGDHSVSFTPKNSFNDQGVMGLMPQSVSAHFEKQRIDFEQFIHLQNERLRIAMQEQRKHQTALLLKKYESKTCFLLKQKEEELARASTRATELHDFLKRMEIESQAWQRAARENEAAIASLHEAIGRLRESVALSAAAADDAGSCCRRDDEKCPEINCCDEEESGIIARKMACRCCNVRDSCVVMMPCRHLCSCRDCEVFLDSCPVCRVVKEGSIEALI